MQKQVPYQPKPMGWNSARLLFLGEFGSVPCCPNPTQRAIPPEMGQPLPVLRHAGVACAPLLGEPRELGLMPAVK